MYKYIYTYIYICEFIYTYIYIYRDILIYIYTNLRITYCETFVIFVRKFSYRNRHNIYEIKWPVEQDSKQKQILTDFLSDSEIDEIKI
jgi:hypothetical protein